MSTLGLETVRLLTCLQDAGFEFVVVGGVAAVAHGASTPTSDLDVAAPMTADNLARLLTALRPHHPRHATRADLGEITESPEELSRFRLLLITTDLGRVDVMGRVDPIGAHSDLVTVPMELAEGRQFRVLALDPLIDVKAHLRRPKDKTVEAELRAIREFLRQGRGSAESQ